MGKGHRAAIATGIFGLGSAIASVTLQMAYPHARVWIWQTLLWGGVTMMILAGLFLAWEYIIEPRFSRPRARDTQVDPPAKQLVRLEYVWRSPDGLDQHLYASVTAIERVADFVLIGRYATATHYVSGKSEWLWSLPTRLWEAGSLVPGETVIGGMLLRSHVSKNPGDSLRVLKDMNYRSPEGTDWEQGLLLLLEATAHYDGGEVSDRMIVNIRRSGDRQFIDHVEASTLAYMEDRGRFS